MNEEEKQEVSMGTQVREISTKEKMKRRKKEEGRKGRRVKERKEGRKRKHMHSFGEQRSMIQSTNNWSFQYYN